MTPYTCAVCGTEIPADRPHVILARRAVVHIRCVASPSAHRISAPECTRPECTAWDHPHLLTAQGTVASNLSRRSRPVLEVAEQCSACQAEALDADPDRPAPRAHTCARQEVRR
jgi:hypothetical protein